MIATFEALSVFLLFLPGFISQRIVEMLTPRRKRSNMERIIDGGAMSVAIYLVYLAISHLSRLPALPASFTSGTITVDGIASVVILALAVGLGLFLGKGLEFGWIYALLRAAYIRQPKPSDRSLPAKLRRLARRAFSFTRSTGRATVWEDVLSMPQSYLVAVTLKDGRKIVGKCTYFSDDIDRKEIVLEAPDPDTVQQKELQGITVIGSDGRPERFPGPGVFITSSAEIDLIELLGNPMVE